MKNYQKMNIKFSIFFIVVCLLFSVSYFIMDWQWLTTANYRLHEMFGLPILLGYFLIPASVIVGLILYYQYHKKTEKTSKKSLNTLLNALCVLSFLLSILTFSYFSGRVSTSGVERDLIKYEMDNSYYIYINHSQIEINEPQYNSLDNNTAYSYSYYHGKWIFGEYSKLEYINAFDE